MTSGRSQGRRSVICVLCSCIHTSTLAGIEFKHRSPAACCNSFVAPCDLRRSVWPDHLRSTRQICFEQDGRFSEGAERKVEQAELVWRQKGQGLQRTRAEAWQRRCAKGAQQDHTTCIAVGDNATVFTASSESISGPLRERLLYPHSHIQRDNPS